MCRWTVISADQVMWSLCCVTAGMWARARGAVWSGSAHSPLCVRLNWGYSTRNAYALLLICCTIIQWGIITAAYRFSRSILDFRRQKIGERIFFCVGCTCEARSTRLWRCGMAREMMLLHWQTRRGWKLREVKQVNEFETETRIVLGLLKRRRAKCSIFLD